MANEELTNGTIADMAAHRRLRPGPDRRAKQTAFGKPRKGWLQQVMIRTPDITLAELQTDLAQQGINTTLRAWEYRHKTLRARTGSLRSRGAASPTA